ncbi:nitrogen permease regulator-like protein [Cryptosporidium canis]|uniref:Nitrogen permease regulator-like protein n=1 Tax=Cryptosporidium canis TaxID=195482 RepID=A0A9D5DFD4_9CRYT|nr:nitrogen permease regulator-like protein [Cryptosporidium canis]
MNRIFRAWPKIEAIIFCKFDEELGPIVLCSSPTDIFGPDKSQLCSIITKYMLPDIHFAEKTISFAISDKWKAIGVPIFIEGCQYLRNSFQFTICIIVAKNQLDFYEDIYSRHIARTLGSAFRLLEEDCGILYYYCTYTENLPDLLRKATNSSDISSLPKNLLEIIENVRSQLNQKHQVFFEFGNTSVLNFRIRRPSYNIAINPEDVPFPSGLKNISSIQHIGLDFSFIKMLPYINGVNTCIEISKYCSLPIEDVIICLEHLALYGLIIMIDMISSENRYRYIGDKICEHGLYKSLSDECMNSGSVRSFTEKYCEELKMNNIKSIYKFIANGVASKKIARLYEFPIIFAEPATRCSVTEMELIQLCNGNNTLDYIQILFGFNSKSEIKQFINRTLNNPPIYWAYL